MMDYALIISYLLFVRSDIAGRMLFCTTFTVYLSYFRIAAKFSLKR